MPTFGLLFARWFDDVIYEVINWNKNREEKSKMQFSDAPIRATSYEEVQYSLEEPEKYW